MDLSGGEPPFLTCNLTDLTGASGGRVMNIMYLELLLLVDICETLEHLTVRQTRQHTTPAECYDWPGGHFVNRFERQLASVCF